MYTILSECYYSIKEAALKMSVSYHTVLRAVLNGEIKATKLRKQWRIKEADLEAYLESRTTTLINEPEPKRQDTRQSGTGTSWKKWDKWGE